MSITTDYTSDQVVEHAAEQPVHHPDPDRVQHLDPRTLRLDHNVRRNSSPDRAMVSSVRDRGVLQPIIAVATVDGPALVRFGHRRTRAAIAAEATTVPVIVRPVDDDTDEDEIEAERIAAQFDENQNREGLTPAEQLGAFAELAALGKSPGDIARLVKVRRRDVVDGLAAAGHDTVREAVETAQLTLAQGAALAEFADDPEAYDALLSVATGNGRGWESMDQLAARLRDDRLEAAQKAALLAELDQAGLTVVDAPWSSHAVTALEDLTDDPEAPADRGDDEPADEDGSGAAEPAAITPEAHAGCPGHVAFLRRNHAARVRPAPLVAVYACADPLAHGHRGRHRFVKLSHPTAATAAVNETAEQAASRQAAEKDTERVKRRRVRAGNDAWRAAETVRREHLRTLLGRKTPPKGAGGFVATTVTLDAFVLTKAVEKGHGLAALLLTGTEDFHNRDRLLALTDGVSDARGQVIALGLVLAGLEAGTGVHSWRHADDRSGSDWRGESPALGRYLRFLVTTGYPLSPIERFAIGDPVDEADVFTPPAIDGDLDIADDADEPEVGPDADPGAEDGVDADSSGR